MSKVSICFWFSVGGSPKSKDEHILGYILGPHT